MATGGTYRKSIELKPYRDFTVECVKANPKLTVAMLRNMLTERFGPELIALSSNTIGNWLFFGRTGTHYTDSFRRRLPAQAKHEEKQDAPAQDLVPALVTVPSSMDIAAALLGRVVHALNNSDLLDTQLKEAKSRIARLEERACKAEGERDRVLKIHNELVVENRMKTSKEPLPEVGELMRLAKIRGEVKKE